MNILIDRLPSSVEVGGRLYAIDTSYTTSIRFENLMLDDTIDGRHKLLLALNLYFPDIPKDTARALKAVQTFYACDRSGPTVLPEAPVRRFFLLTMTRRTYMPLSVHNMESIYNKSKICTGGSFALLWKVLTNRLYS